MTKLYKSKSNRVLLGVCGGLADATGIDAPFLRLAFVLGAVFTGSMLFWLYLLMALVLPTKE